MQLRIHLLHKTNTYIKRSTLFAIALILSVTSLTALITPKAEATSLPNMVADSSFDIGSGFQNGSTSSIYSIAIQPNGKILVGGNFTTFNGATQNRLVRLNADGSKDSSFNIETGFNSTVWSTTSQPDGKILVGGNFTSFNGATQNYLVRLNADGSKDSSFDIGAGLNGLVWSIAIQPNGKILVGGNFTTFNGATQNRLVRLNADGTKDSSFDIGSGLNAAVYSIAIQPNGKILVGGDFTSFNGATQNYLVRLNADGSKDSSFDIGIGLNAIVYSIAIQPDGKILVGGNFTTFNGATQNRLVRLNADGSKDSSFDIGSGLNAAVYSIAIQPNGKILVGGNFTTFNGATQNRLVRLNADGSKDSSFDIGSGLNAAVYSIAIQPNGKILVGGDFTSFNGATQNRLVRLNADGSKDSSFDIGIGLNAIVYSIAIQPNGKILVGGDFTSFNGATQNYLVRLNADGSKDSSFDIGIGLNAIVYSIAIQPDGKILVGGNFTTFNGATQNRLVRLNADGSKDSSFNIETGFNSTVWSTTSQPDGKILVGGNFTTFNGATQNRLVRLNADGSKDSSFDIGAGLNGLVWSIAIQPNGKILVGGNFTTFNGATQNRLVRLNADGTKDSSFDIGAGLNAIVRSIAIQPDGKILVGGNFTTFNGATQNRLVRLNADGSKDTSFNIGSGLNALVFVYSTAIQPDGKILVGGNFTTYNGTTQNYLIRLNADGSKDTSFDIGSGLNSTVYSTALQPDGKILVGGNFSAYNNQYHGGLVRLQLTNDKDADGLDDSIEDSSPNSGDANQDGTLDSLQNNVTSYINPVTNQPMIIQVDSQCSLTNVSTNPSTNNSTQDTNFNYPLGLYNFTANCGTPGYTTNFKAYYYGADTTKNYTLRKYNPNTNTYTTIDNATFAVETIAGIPVLTATYTITDGSSLDTDGLANGTIVDPAGPALTNPTTATPATLPTAPNTGLNKNNLLVILLAVATISIITIISYMVRTKRTIYKI